MSSTTPHIAETLLGRAHSPATAARLFQEKVLTKPLPLRPTSPPPATAVNARDARQLRRKQERAKQRRSQKPRPLSAKQKRALGVYEIPKEQQKYAIYEPLHRMWRNYIRGVLGLEETSVKYSTPADAGPKLASADFHGAEVEVVRSRCVDRVGVKGLVVKDTKFTFEIITKKNELKTLPKEHTVFRLQIPWIDNVDTEKTTFATKENEAKGKCLVFEIHGSQFEHRPTDRAKKQFRLHNMPDL